MCGFVGFVGGTDNQSEVLTKMMDRIVHRGPDMGGQFIDGRVALGFRRLSILDLTEAGAQPMANEDGSVVIVFNGEIYNFKELRGELEAKGYTFHCGADTESLLHGYEEWGEAVLDRLRGMYAFVIWDKKKNKLFGARDIFRHQAVLLLSHGRCGRRRSGRAVRLRDQELPGLPALPQGCEQKGSASVHDAAVFGNRGDLLRGCLQAAAAHYFTSISRPAR